MNNEDKVLLIINPKAGKKKPMSTLTDILDVFGRHGIKVTSMSTTGPGDAQRFTAERAGEFDAVVCCGGDGTLNEVITGLMSSSLSVPIGYIPMGTANDFAKGLGLSSDPIKAVEDVIKGKPVPHDIGSFNGDIYFSYVASFGTMSDISYLTSQKMKNMLGHSAYLLKAAPYFFRMKPYHVKVEFEDKVFEDEFLLGGTANSKSVAGMVKLKDKTISLDDGIFELIFFRKPRNLSGVANIIRWLLTQNPNNPSVIFEKAESALLTCKEYVPWTVDGEFAGLHNKIELKVHYHAISFIRPV